MKGVMQMLIDSIPEKAWEELLIGPKDRKFHFLALQILLYRLRVKLQHENSPQTMSRCIQEIKDFFVQNQKIPKAQLDLQNIMDGRFCDETFNV